MSIHDRDRLASCGDTPARQVVLAVLDAALEALDVSHVIPNILSLEGDALRIGPRRWDVDR